MEGKNNKKNIISLIVLCVSIVALTTSLTYAYFVSQVGEKVEERFTITSGTLALTFKDNDETIENIEGTWNFGDTIEKELVIENTGTREAYAKISWDNLVNTYLKESLTYTLEEKTDEEGSTWKKVETESKNVPRSETSSTQVLADHLLIPAGHTYTYRLRITFENLADIDQTPDINASFVTKFTIAESTKKMTTEDKLVELGIKVNPTNKTTGFETPAKTDETANGLFSMEDDYGTSYYYRGTAPNNYIKFGKNASGQDMWWRIIRFNGDGSIRMQYDGAGASGTNTYTRDFALTSQVWNSKQDDAKYVGWMFGGAQGVASTSKEGAQRNETSSPIKIAVDAWYKGNIVDTGYGNYVHDAIFCNDRSTPGKNVTGLTSDTGLGYGKNETGYGALGRFMTGNNGTNLGSHLNPKPQFTCPQENDKFTVSTVKGNGSLEYPVGLITADEIVAAGSGKYDTANESYYLYKGWRYWSFSPRYMQIGYYTYTYMFYISSSGSLNGYSDLHYDNKVAPVINIKPEYISHLEGSGTIDSPWTLK